MKKNMAQKATIPDEIAATILCLRPYQNDVVPEELVFFEGHGYEAAQEAAFKILRVENTPVVRVILCGMDEDAEITESGVVWTIPDAKPWYVETRETFESAPKTVERFVKKEEAYAKYRDYRQQNIITETNARTKKNGEV